MPEQKCGKCRWWKAWQPSDQNQRSPYIVGDCHCPVPDAMLGQRRAMNSNHGQTCPTYEAKEESDAGN